MKWTAIWSNRAKKDLGRLPKDTAIRILKKTDDVISSPFQHLERLENSPLFKYRVGKYRVIVEVINDKLIVHLLKVKKRSRAY